MGTTNKYYDALIKFKKDYPALTFDNDGYQYIPLEVRKAHKSQIDEISEILKQTIKGFVEFNNFKPRKNGSFSVRCQYKYDRRFTGVGYFDIEDFRDFKDFDETKE